MPGTKEGGKKARETNFKKYGKDYYQKLTRKGGRAGTKGGFASEVVGKDGLTGPQRAKIVGSQAGKVSRIVRKQDRDMK